MEARMHNFSTWVTDTEPIALYERFYLELENAGFGIVGVLEKHFEPHGYTALFLLSESHFAIHTFPEKGQTYIELSSCVKQPFDNFIKSICNG